MKRLFQINTKAKEAEILLYDVVGQSYWGDGVSSKKFAEQLAGIKDVERIVLRINSPGGDVFEGAAIYTLLTQSSIPVDVIVDGLAASAAFSIAMAGRTISIGEAAMMMAHNAWMVAIGDHNQLRKSADMVEKVSSTFAAVYAKRSGKSDDEVAALMDAETWYTAQEAVDNGFADEVLQSGKKKASTETDIAASFDLSVFRNLPAAFKASQVNEKPENSSNSTENDEENNGNSESVPVSVLARKLNLACLD